VAVKWVGNACPDETALFRRMVRSEGIPAEVMKGMVEDLSKKVHGHLKLSNLHQNRNHQHQTLNTKP